jgi:hypothetical protein
MAQMTYRNRAVGPKYAIGQKVIIHPVDEKGLTQRETDVTSFSGQIGQIANFYSISPTAGQIFHIYKVRVGKDKKEIVVYEDEMEANLT